MQYRTLAGERISVLGFGCMRLPMRAGEVNELETARLLHHAVERGVNYVDTAYSYHDGESEPVLGRALAGGWRDRVLLATKLPSWRASSLDECDRILTDQLERLQTDHLDFYLVHNLIRPRWEQVRDIGVLDWLRDVRSEGRIRHVGFSFHDEIDCFKSIIDAWDWDFCQIQYNYMDEHVQAGTEGLLYAADRDIDVVVMEPLRGGALGRKLPKDLETRRRRLGIEWSPGQLALRWVLDHPEVRVALSGMNRMDHLEENLAVADATPPGGMTGVEREFIATVRDRLHRSMEVECTGCRYCLPCPQGVDIPRVFSLCNDMSLYGLRQRARMFYTHLTPPDQWADRCVECGQCEAKCPQHIPIVRELKRAHRALTAGPGIWDALKRRARGVWWWLRKMTIGRLRARPHREES